jgi:toxin ParE1/3/4
VSGKTVIRRAQARRDIQAAVDYYFTTAGDKTALRFVDAVEAAIEGIAKSPEAGSPRYSYILGLPGLRFWLVQRFPYLVFYFEGDEHVDVWRVLHGARDLPAWLSAPDDA